MKKNILILIGVILAAIAVRYGISAFDGYMTGKKQAKRPAPSVTVEPVRETDLIRSFEAPGRVTSKYRVDVLARISGYLQKSYFKEGDFVKAGQTLFLIEPTEYANASNVAKADVENTKAQLAYAEKQLARAEELVKKDYIAKSQYDSMLSQRDALKAQLAASQARYNDSVRNLDYTNVKAPVDGLVGIISVTLGNYVSPSSGALTTINSTNPIYVTFPMDSEDFAMLSYADGSNNTNRKAELIFPNGQKYPKTGIQDFHDNKIDQSTGTVTMRATFDNTDNYLLHGEFVTIKLYANKPVKTPVVPQIAVLENQEGKFVYKIDEKGLPALTYIKVSGQEGSDWIVTKGLNAGDKVITDGLQKVIPGRPVNVVSKEEMNKQKQNNVTTSNKENNNGIKKLLSNFNKGK